MKKWICFALLLVFLLPIVGCGAKKAVVPDDFAFALTWNHSGISSYDSQTGMLVKEADTATEYRLSEEDEAHFYELISTLDLDAYPEDYDPQNGKSKPPMSLILTVCCNGTQKTIRAEAIGAEFTSEDPQGQAFLTACKGIIDRLTATAEWEALPEFENTVA